MASLKFRHYATESDLKGTGEIQNALNAFDVGTIVFIDDTQKQYIITGKNNNVVTYKIYYGKAAIVGVTGTGATRTLTFSDGSEITITINDVEHATTSDSCSGNAKSATTLQTARKINGTNFNGSADITTSKWGEFRNIGIVNSDGTGTAVTVSVNGSSNINLKLPETIKANLDGNASSATKATNDGGGNTITTTYATKTERANNDITAVSLNTTALTLTRAAGNITANIPTWNQDTTGTAAKAIADAKGNNIVNTYATKAEVAALPKSMVIKGTLDASHTLPTSGMIEGDTYIVGAKGTYNNIVCKVGDFFVRTSDSWLRIPAGDEWEYNENTIKAIKVDNAGHADTAGTAVSAGSATNDSNGNNIVNTYARIDKVYSDSSAYRQFLGKGGSSTDWIRTTESGIIPYTSGDSANGHSMLGTPSWYFSKAYIQNIYGYLHGNISGSSTSCSGNSLTASKLTNLAGSDTASSSTTWRKVWFSYDDGITGRPALSDNFTYQSSTNTLKVPNLTLSGNATISGTTTVSTLTVNGKASFNNGLTGTLTGNLIGNANTASSCSGNAATATKLQTARTIWGQSFNGSGNITGPIHVKYKSSEWGNWNEGIRLYGSAASGVWSNIHFGCNPNATSGSHTNQWMIGRNAGNHFGIWHGTDSTNAVFFINTSNNVGIGTTSPTSKLHVAGTGYFTSDVSSASNIIAGSYIKGETVKISSGCTLQYDSAQKCVKFVF